MQKYYLIIKIKIFLKYLYIKLISPNEAARILGVKFGNNCSFNSKNFGGEPYLVKIGDYVRTSTNVTFITHDGSVHVLRNLYEEYKNIDYFSPIIIGNNVFIGYDSVILPGTKIDDNVIVGARSLVRGHLQSNSVYAGTPANYICSIEEYKNKNKNKFLYTHDMNSTVKDKYIKNWVREKYNIF